MYQTDKQHLMGCVFETLARELVAKKKTVKIVVISLVTLVLIITLNHWFANSFLFLFVSAIVWLNVSFGLYLGTWEQNASDSLYNEDQLTAVILQTFPFGSIVDLNDQKLTLIELRPGNTKKRAEFLLVSSDGKIENLHPTNLYLHLFITPEEWESFCNSITVVPITH